MESSAPKRRRVSPRTAVSLPPTQAETTTPQDSPSNPGAGAKRPSFASPTRASLQRYNPGILERRSSSKPRRSEHEPEPVPEQDAPPSASRPDTAQSNDGLSQALAAHIASQPVPDVGSGEATLEQGRGNEGGESSYIRSPARRPGRPSRPPAPPPPPPGLVEDDEDDILLNPFARRGLRRSTEGYIPEIPLEEMPEPELPPTPEHPDPVVSTPPSGIHSTPSKRPKRSQYLAQRLKGSSSPLKQPVFGKPSPTKPTKGSKLRRQVTPPGLQFTTAELRCLPPLDDPDADKKRLRDSLRAEVTALERDIGFASNENERIRRARLANRSPSPPPNASEIIGVLRRHALPPEDDRKRAEEKEDPSTAWLRAALLNPIAFLPFSKTSAVPFTLPLPPQDNNDKAKDEEPKPISHRPLPMTAAEALPYLQVFTPLAFTSHVAPLPQETDNEPLFQRHSISATSTAPRGIFTARLEMTVNTKTMAITELAVPRLDPAAVAELGPFIESVVSTKPPRSSGLTNNVSVLCWAMGEWLRIAVQRAKVWRVLEAELGGDKERLIEMVAKTRLRKKNQKRKRRNVDGEEQDEDVEDEIASLGGGKDSTEALLSFMGRTSMDFEIPVLDHSVTTTKGKKKAESNQDDEDSVYSMLRVQWRIEFDWTGEARSRIGVLVGVPGKWHKHDERGELFGIPKLFDELVQDGGEDPLTAVRTVVSLLAGEQQVRP